MSRSNSTVELSRIESYQYPAAHVGHLSPSQDRALQKFKHLCEQRGYYTPPGVDGRDRPSHDDEELLRYLRARKFNPQDAYVQFKDTEDWRKENQLDKLYDTIDIAEYEQTRRLYPQWTGRRDRRGIPVYVFEVGGLNTKALNAYESATKSSTNSTKAPTKMLRLFALYENLCRFVMPLCTAIPDRPHVETPVSQSNNIVDISHVGLKQFWNLKQHMQDASTLATAHYPETLDRIFIIGAPSFFPTVWGWIKRWFDPITVSKIFILSSGNMKSTLEQYIEPQNIPKKYGGQLDFQFGDLPILEPAIERTLTWLHPQTQKAQKTFPTGPIVWKENGDGEMVAVAVGSEHGKQRATEVASLKASHYPPARQHLAADTGRAGAALFRTTSGYATHPTTPIDEEELRPPSEDELPDRKAAATATSQTGTYDIPYRDFTTPSQAPPTGGTSSTRYMQQEQTHAEGQSSEGTPRVRDDGAGDKHAVMQPATVGQAPKEVPLTSPPDEPDSSYIAQAKEVASNAYESVASAGQSVMSAVGYAGETRQSPPSAQIKEEKEPRAEEQGSSVKTVSVEEYLRAQYSSKGQQTG
ncbi:hypothetical protein LTR66_005365 [Elasticomyces elasticus]|nr:hypothetical protein LTR66_005365 [Elasticomyces elasticus]